MARILIIDDEPMVRVTLRKALQKAGHEVSEADNGQTGLQTFHEVTPDLVITDIVMPDKEGVETIIELRKNNPDAKIIAISGGGRTGSQDFLEAAKAFGAQHTLPKPFDPDQLIALVETCLAKAA